MFYVITLLGPHRLCWVGRCHRLLQKLWTTQSATVSHGCARSMRTWLAQALLNQLQPFHPRLLVTNVCCIKVAINSERGIACNASSRAHRPDSASASRLLVSTPSPLSYPILRRLRHSRYFAVCNAFVNPSAVFVCVGSLITVNLRSSCFASSHKSLVSMCLRGLHPCRWMMPRAAVESILNRSLTGIAKNSRSRRRCIASAVVVTAA